MKHPSVFLVIGRQKTWINTNKLVAKVMRMDHLKNKLVLMKYWRSSEVCFLQACQQEH